MHKRSFEGVRKDGIPRLEWMMWTTLLKTTQGMILLARALKNLSISIFIKVLPTSVSRILATQHTTMMNSDGRANAKEDNTFSDFTIARPRKQNLDDRPRDI